MHTILTFSVFLWPEVSDTTVEPYNTMNFVNQPTENAHECMFLDNKTLYGTFFRMVKLETEFAPFFVLTFYRWLWSWYRVHLPKFWLFLWILQNVLTQISNPKKIYLHLAPFSNRNETCCSSLVSSFICREVFSILELIWNSWWAVVKGNTVTFNYFYFYNFMI